VDSLSNLRYSSSGIAQAVANECLRALGEAIGSGILAGRVSHRSIDKDPLAGCGS